MRRNKPKKTDTIGTRWKWHGPMLITCRPDASVPINSRVLLELSPLSAANVDSDILKMIENAPIMQEEIQKLRAASEPTRRGALQAVPTPADADDMAEAAMKLIDDMGKPPLPRAAWIGLLLEIESQCRTRIAAAQEDDDHGR